VEGESILQTIAEISVAFAGFTGVVAAFGRGGAAPWTAGDRLRFRVMLGTSLAALSFAILPLIFYYLGVRGASVWSLSSFLLGIYLLGSAVFDVRVFQRGRVDRAASDPPSPVVATVVAVLSIGMTLVQFLNALGILFQRTFGAYLLGLSVLLALSSLMFVRLLSFVGREDT